MPDPKGNNKTNKNTRNVNKGKKRKSLSHKIINLVGKVSSKYINKEK